MKETNKIYKLATLYMLSKVDVPISTNRLSYFLLKNEYTDYFTFQQGLGELLNDKWVDLEEIHSKTLFSITKEGRHALELLSKEISDSMKHDIDEYLKSNKIEIRDDYSVKARSYQFDVNNFVSALTIEEDEKQILEIKISSSSQEDAEKICANWKKSCEDIYPMLVGMLMK